MGASPSDRHLDRGVDCLPTDSESRGSFFPAQDFGPIGQKPSQCNRHPTLAFSPAKQFDLHSTTRTVATSWRVDQEHDDAPKGHELVAVSYTHLTLPTK